MRRAGPRVAAAHRVSVDRHATFNADEQYGSCAARHGTGPTSPIASRTIAPRTARRKAHVRIGWLRSVANIYHAFACIFHRRARARRPSAIRVEYLLDLIGAPRNIDLGARACRMRAAAIRTSRRHRAGCAT